MYSLFDSPTRTQRIQEENKRTFRKKALYVALNYYNEEVPDSGSVLESQKLSETMKLQYHFNDSMEIFDSPSTPVSRAQILNGFDFLLRGCEKGDVLFFHFIGRSIGKTLCTSDGDITEEDIRNWLIEPLPLGVTLFCIIDADFSGLNMRYNFCDASSGKTHSSQGSRGLRIESTPFAWKSSHKSIENLEVAETHAPFVSIYSGSNRGLLTYSINNSFQNVYPHSLSLSMILTQARACFAANASKNPCSLDSGQYLDLEVPIGRLLGCPI